ncbi:S-layer homology domain-containing protein [Bacillus salitolerans]|uniref:S-layer homology domain-containing protein n=1 Tax=Bacillus salitolerans TaxID=1437434 RepID=A0ABW4LRT0_9BACI
MKYLKGFLLFLLATSVLMPYSAEANSELPKSIGKAPWMYTPHDISDHWARETLLEFLHADIMTGYIEHNNATVNLEPNSPITRAQFIKILSNALELQYNETSPSQSFSDVHSTDWFSKYVEIASSLGIIKGSEGAFHPNSFITRDQATALIIRAFGEDIKTSVPETQLFKDIKTDYWAYDFIQIAKIQGIINGYVDEFRPRELATRAQASTMIKNALLMNLSKDNTEPLLVFEDYLTKRMELIAEKDLIGLFTLTNELTSNYFLSISEGEINFIESLESLKGLELISIETFPNWNTELLYATERYAAIKMTGFKYTLTTRDPIYNMKTIHTETCDGVYNLKKTGKEWKIYSYVPSNYWNN